LLKFESFVESVKHSTNLDGDMAYFLLSILRGMDILRIFQEASLENQINRGRGLVGFLWLTGEID
jgi:hypothetical protein